MNKKFSTLFTMGLLATGSLCSSAWAADPIAAKINGSSLQAVKLTDDAGKAIDPSGSYIIVADANGNGVAEKGEYVLTVTANAKNGALEYKGHALSATEDLEDLASLTWSFSEIPVKDANGKADGYLYSLYNAGVGAYLTTDANLDLITNKAKSSHDASKDQYARFSVQDGNLHADRFKQKDGLYLYKADNKTITNALEVAATISAKASAASPLILCELSEKVLAGTELDVLNDVMGGEGFALTFKDDDKYETNILKDQNLKVFYVSKAIPMGNGNIPSGMYLATDYPESLIGTDQITKKADFEACTFIAVDGDKNYDIHKADRANGIGFDFTTVKGDAFNYYNGTDKKELSEPGEIYVGNAHFEIVVANPLAGYETYNLRLPEIRVAADKTTEHANKKDVYVGTIKDQRKNYLLTSATAADLSTTNSTLYAPTGLLNAEDVPAVYTIQFVSGEKELKEGQASEYGQYLAPILKTNVSRSYLFASVGEANGNDPMYQYVVTAVDQANKTITFYNRLTKAKIAMSLYHSEEDAENVYTVFAASKDAAHRVENFYVEEVSGPADQSLVYDTPLFLHKKKVLLTKIDYTTIDKFATFMNREEGAGVVKFRLAKNSVADGVFYAGAARVGKDKEIATGAMKAWEDYADNFELIKSDDSLLIVTDYVYNYKDDADNEKDVWRKSVEKDTVAFYTYKIKLFDDENEYYVTATENGLVQLSDVAESAATDFIIRENPDGSIALIKDKGNRNGAALAFMEVETHYAFVTALDDEENAWRMKRYLDRVPGANLKTFIEEESGAISLEAVAQHVSMQATEGGFVAAKDGEGKIAIATEVSDALKFWVEPQDDKANIPSFYIANAGRYMYYAKDSALYAPKNKDQYTFGSNDTKLIFKAGELVNADTLKTTVDNKTVYVAEKGNPSKNVKAGLGNFLYQIVKFEEGSDEYVIRKANTNYYVRNINGQLTLDWGRKDALKVTIESQEAPTANEGVEVSEVKVIAGEGNLTIAGAQGKKVVISNILGQVVANTVIASDNAVIAAPAGVVVVAVEGEAAVKAIVK